MLTAHKAGLMMEKFIFLIYTSALFSITWTNLSESPFFVPERASTTQAGKKLRCELAAATTGVQHCFGVLGRVIGSLGPLDVSISLGRGG